MPSNTSILFLALWLLVTALFVYSSYWALAIRRALVTSLYRREALWIGGMGIFFVVLSAFLTIALSFQLNSLATNILGGLIISGGFVLIFLWIDSTVLIARRSDPLFRDTLRWSRLRYLFWLATLGAAAGSFATAIESGFSTIAPYGGVLLFGAIALLISARRSGDSTLRRHLSWTGLCVFLLWLGSQAQDPLSRVISDPYLVQSLIYPLVAGGAYSLYRSAKSLVPLGHLSIEDVRSTTDSSIQPGSRVYSRDETNRLRLKSNERLFRFLPAVE